MFRTLERHLSTWFNNPRRKPLILRGARQVGKTALVRQFASKYTLHEINLEEHQQLKASIISLNLEAFLKEVQIICKKGSVGGADSILFIDEIQEIPEALTLLRYLYEKKPELKVIAAGSLLEFALSDKEREFSMPVGRVEYAYLGPMTFSEFLFARNEVELEKQLRGFTLDENFSPTAHNQLLELFHLYLLIGGMPEAQQVYLDTGDLQQVLAVQAAINSTYRDDFAKYAKRSALTKLQKVFDYAPTGVGRKVKYSNIDKEIRSAELKTALQLLQMANVVLFAHGTDALQFPLGGLKEIEVYKFYFLDCGLLNSLSGLSLVPKTTSILPEYKGKIFEQFVAQHLAYSGLPYQRPELFYWLREGKSNNAEVDFLLSSEGKVIPLEVKSGPSGTLRSLHQFLARAESKNAVRLDLNMPSRSVINTALTSDPKIKVHGELISLPIYAVEQIQRVCKELE